MPWLKNPTPETPPLLPFERETRIEQSRNQSSHFHQVNQPIASRQSPINHRTADRLSIVLPLGFSSSYSYSSYLASPTPPVSQSVSQAPVCPTPTLSACPASACLASPPGLPHGVIHGRPNFSCCCEIALPIGRLQRSFPSATSSVVRYFSTNTSTSNNAGSGPNAPLICTNAGINLTTAVVCAVRTASLTLLPIRDLYPEVCMRKRTFLFRLPPILALLYIFSSSFVCRISIYFTPAHINPYVRIGYIFFPSRVVSSGG